MLWLLPWLCAVPLASCSFDDDIDQGGDGTATLQLSITAREEGDLNTRADEVGTNGEYMHNLCVLIVGGNNVVTKNCCQTPMMNLSVTPQRSRAI